MLKLYPNPANNKLFISTDKELDNIEVYDISGRILISSGYNKEGIDVSTLPAGSYIVSAKSGNSKTVSKFIKE